MRLLSAISGVIVAVMTSSCLGGVVPLGQVKITGTIKAPEDLSGIAKVGSLLVIGSDEAVGSDENENYIQVLRQTGTDAYRVDRDILIYKGGKEEEMDIEGIAADGNTFFVVGSHSSKRDRIKKNRKYATNRKKFRDDEIDDETNRDRLCRLSITSQGISSNIECKHVRDIIKADPVLKTFGQIPGKENGVNIEGIAAKAGSLYLGFRGPVFREQYVPVIKFKFKDPTAYELLYVNLGGFGIRDMTCVSDGFLIVAGPVGEGSGSYELYHWDGKDVIPGKDRDPADVGKVKLLGRIPLPKDGKAEGIVVMKENNGSYEFIIIYDGVNGGAPQRFRADRP